MPPQTDGLDWDFSSAIELLKSLSLPNHETSRALFGTPEAAFDHDQTLVLKNNSSHLGDFSSLWSLFPGSTKKAVDDAPLLELVAAHTSKGVRRRREVDGADLEGNVEHS